MVAPVAIQAAEGEDRKQPTFSVVAYTGGAMNVDGWDAPLAIDLKGLGFSKALIANLDHDKSKRVGHVTSKAKDDGQVVLGGVASAATPWRDEVVNSAAGGFIWQASVEAHPDKVEELAAGSSETVNGNEIHGPAYIVRRSTLQGFAFVSNGADDDTTVTIAAEAARKVTTMKSEIKAWIEGLGLEVDTLSEAQVASLTADYEGRAGTRPNKIEAGGNPFEKRKAEVKRRQSIREASDRFIEMRNADITEIEAIEQMHDHAIEAGMSPQDFRLEMYESATPPPQRVESRRDRGREWNERVIQAAVCQAGRLASDDDLIERHHFTDQEMQAAHDRFHGRIGLKQLFILAAQANGHRHDSFDVSIDVQRAAFGMTSPRSIQASGFSTVSLSTILSNTANKFLREGWNSVDQTALRIAAIRPVSDFKQITTVSLTGALEFEKVGQDGEIKHGEIDEVTYTNQADTYARMLAITRKDIINDDLGALTVVPRKLGRGGMLKLNDIFWTEFLGLVGAAFFASGNSNLNEGVATMTTGGLAATETIFMNQTDPDSKPLGVMPKIILVPTALKSAARTLMNSERLIDGTGTATQGDGNIWKDMFRVESSPYISNSSYTGYTATGWWMLADPGEMPVIEIAALNGRVEPVVETADADFNVLGVQMRGYSDIGVSDQEYRGGVYADGGAS
jgi:hypothetical protein